MKNPEKWWSKYWSRLFPTQPSATSPTTPTLPPVAGQQTAPVYDLRIQLLGSVQFHSAEGAVPELRSARHALLLAYLAYKYGQKIPRDKLMGQFWPEVHQESARNSLNVAVCHIRRHFQGSIHPQDKIIVHQGGSYRLNPDWVIQTDVQKFEHYLQLGRKMDQQEDIQGAISAYRKAIQYYRGDFMEEFPYEDWVYHIREYFRENYMRALDRLGHLYLENRETTQALFLFKEMVRRDPALENAHRSLMWCYAQEGHRDRAVRQFRKCEAILKAEFATAPSPQTLALYEEILRGEVPQKNRFNRA